MVSKNAFMENLCKIKEPSIAHIHSHYDCVIVMITVLCL